MKCIFGFEDCPITSQEIETKPYQFFIGYQIHSKWYSQSAILAMGSRICEILKSDLQKKDLRIIISQFGFKPAVHILCDACELIQKSILCIFEISDLNPNVMIEIGKSLSKNIVLLRNKNSNKPPPTDIGGVYYEEYDNEEELIQLKSAKIARIINEKILEHHKSYYFEDIFYLKEDITKICKDGEFKEDIDWDNLLEIYDEEKLKDAHDYTIIGIAKYKKIKRDYLYNNAKIEDFDEVKKYFVKSKSLNNKIIENDYYLYQLDLFRLSAEILINNENDFINVDKLQQTLDEEIEGYSDVKKLIDIFYNRNLKKFLFVDSPMLMEDTVSQVYEIRTFGKLNIYNVLRFQQKKGIINDFNKKILELLKRLNQQSRYVIIGKMGRELQFNDIGEDIINFIENSIEAENKPFDPETSFYILDKDLKEKLSYLLGIFEDKRAENTLITLIDSNRDGVIYPAIDALVKINSVKSLPILINIYKNLDVEFNIKIRVYHAIKALAEKNSFHSLKEFIEQQEVGSL